MKKELINRTGWSNEVIATLTTNRSMTLDEIIEAVGGTIHNDREDENVEINGNWYYYEELCTSDEMELFVAVKETGLLLDSVLTVEEGLELIEDFETQDKEDGVYSENYYEVCDKERISFI